GDGYPRAAARDDPAARPDRWPIPGRPRAHPRHGEGVPAPRVPRRCRIRRGTEPHDRVAPDAARRACCRGGARRVRAVGTPTAGAARAPHKAGKPQAGLESWARAIRAQAPVLVVGLAFAVLVLITWATWGDLAHDTGYDFVAADRIAHGHLPYADFPYIYGP